MHKLISSTTGRLLGLKYNMDDTDFSNDRTHKLVDMQKWMSAEVIDRRIVFFRICILRQNSLSRELKNRVVGLLLKKSLIILRNADCATGSTLCR